MRCPACDTANPPEAVRCEKCGEKLERQVRAGSTDKAEVELLDQQKPVKPLPRRRPVRRDNDDDDAYDSDGGISTLIPYKNPKALASYYCGVFSLIPVIGLPLGIVALVLGILGLRFRSAHPKAKGTAHAIVGMVLGLIGTLHCIPVSIFVLFWTLSEKH
jgi:hypothetical protein